MLFDIRINALRAYEEHTKMWLWIATLPKNIGEFDEE